MVASALGFNRETGRFETVAAGMTPQYKTTTYTAAAGEHVWANTTSGAWTLTLPASPSVDQMVRVSDAAGTFGTNALTVARNGQTIDGAASNFLMEVGGWDVLFVFTGATWRVIGLTAFKRIQRGTVTVAGGLTSATGTVSAVNLDRATVSNLGFSTDRTDARLDYALIRIALTNSTTLTASRGGVLGTGIVSYEIVERW